MNINILKMAEDHITAITEIEKLSFAAPWTRSDLEYQLGSNIAVFYVAVDENDSVVGYVGMHHVIDEGYIMNIAVHPDFRKMEIGEKLIGVIINFGKENKLKRITLEVRKTNIPAQKLYGKTGFEYEATRPNYYDNPREDAYIYSMFL